MMQKTFYKYIVLFIGVTFLLLGVIRYLTTDRISGAGLGDYQLSAIVIGAGFILYFILWYFQHLRESIFNIIFDKRFFYVLGWSFVIFFSFVDSFHEKFPKGYAGLYLLMSEELVNNGFHLPLMVPNYGPGGTPFAYPPLGFYLEGVLTKYLGLNIFTYTLLIPRIFCILSAIALYFLALRLLKNKNKALISAIFLTTSPSIFSAHATAAGIVRSPAFFLALVSLIFAYDSLQQYSYLKASIGGMLLGLTILTHLQYAVFVVLSSAIFTLLCLFQKLELNSFSKIVRSLKVLLLIYITSMIVSFPWWMVIINHFGVNIIFRVMNTHGTLDFISYLNIKILNHEFWSSFTPWAYRPLIGIGIMGLIWALFKGEYILPVWYFASYFVISEQIRYLELIGCLLAANFIVDIFDFASEPGNKFKQIKKPILILVLIGFMIGSVYSDRILYKPVLSDDVITLSVWVQKNTRPEDTYLFVSTQEVEIHDLGEWLPYLLRRTPIVGHWGSEWLGTYNDQYGLFIETYQDLSETKNIALLLEQKSFMPDFIVVSKSYFQTNLSHIDNFSLEYSNSTYEVYKAIHDNAQEISHGLKLKQIPG